MEKIIKIAFLSALIGLSHLNAMDIYNKTDSTADDIATLECFEDVCAALISKTVFRVQVPMEKIETICISPNSAKIALYGKMYNRFHARNLCISTFENEQLSNTYFCDISKNRGVLFFNTTREELNVMIQAQRNEARNLVLDIKTVKIIRDETSTQPWIKGNDNPDLIYSSIDGSLKAISSYHYYHSINVYDLATGSHKRTIQETSEVHGPSFSSDNTSLAYGIDKKIKVISLTTGDCIKSFDTEKSISCTTWNHDNTILAAAHNVPYGDICLYNTDTGQAETVTNGFAEEITCLCFNPAGKRLYVGGMDGRLHILDINKIQAILQAIKQCSKEQILLLEKMSKARVNERAEEILACTKVLNECEFKPTEKEQEMLKQLPEIIISLYDFHNLTF